MTYNFMSFSTVFQFSQDDGYVKMKGCVQRSPVYIWKDLAQVRIEPGNANSAGQRLTYWATESPSVVELFFFCNYGRNVFMYM